MFTQDSLLINVLTELIKLIVLAFILALSCEPCPNEGSFCTEPHPTIDVSLLYTSSCPVLLTSSQESVLGEYSDRIDQQY